MVLPAEDGPSPTPTLRPGDSGPFLAPLDTSANPKGQTKDIQKALSSTLNDAYQQWISSQSSPVREGKSGPEIYKTTGGGSKTLDDNGNVVTEGGKGEWVPLGPQDRGWQLWNLAQQEATDLKEGDYGAGGFASGSGAGAGRSYVDTEGDKQDEVTRQFKDFLARAKGTYDLMDSERRYAMAGDDQNAANAKAVRGGYLNSAWATPYADQRGPGYSDTLARSMPNYLSPDYRMNQAVGLGGPEGFNNPNYDSSGMPMYAEGTDPATASIPPDPLEMVGKPIFVPPDGAPPSGKPWPWGRRVV
jgi:hypothetical protein